LNQFNIILVISNRGFQVGEMIECITAQGKITDAFQYKYLLF